MERTQSGMIRAKLAGKQFGRPPALSMEERVAVVERLDAGASIAEIARIQDNSANKDAGKRSRPEITVKLL
jgi:putative DNA-invertase from lambdoid prophage Rac